jgi:hypothetical protein
MIDPLISTFMNKVSDRFSLPITELEKAYLLTLIEKEEEVQNEVFKNELAGAVAPFCRLKQDVMFQFGQTDPYYSTRNLVIFAFNHTLVRPKEGRKYPQDVHDWEWVNLSIKKLLLYYLRMSDYRMVVISNEIISWKLEMMMNVLNEILPAYGRATILIGVNQRFPNMAHFLHHFPMGSWRDAMVVGTTEDERQFAKELSVDFFTQDQVYYDE